MSSTRLNRRTLCRRQKIVPVDYWGRTPELSGLGRRLGRFAEAEEFVNIPNVSKHLIGIIMSQTDQGTAVAAIRMDAMLCDQQSPTAGRSESVAQVPCGCDVFAALAVSGRVRHH